MSLTPDPDLDYLAADFDPNTLTAPKLRNILVSHNVSYPASAKKAQLVEIFDEHVVPQARKVLASRARTKRTSRGITDVESSQGSTIADDDEVPPLPQPAEEATRIRKRSSRTPARASTEEMTPPATTSTQPRKKHGRSSDTEGALELESKRPTVRKTSKSEITPPIKSEEMYEPIPARDHRADEGVFSRDNPFQSGSSPLSEARSSSRERRRKSSAPFSVHKYAARRKSSLNRRKTEQLAMERPAKIEDGVNVPTLDRFDMAVTHTGQIYESDDGIEAGEEFAPDETEDLIHAQLTQLTQATGRSAKRRKTSSASSVLKTAPVAILSVLFAAYALLYRQEKIAIGYCNLPRSSDSPATSLTGIEFPELLSFLEPRCEPCPPHAQCFSSFVLRCDPDFVLQPHPLSLGGLVPLPPTCEPDGEKVRKVKAVADRAVEELREIRASYECGTTLTEGQQAASTPAVDEVVLKDKVSRKRRRGMSDAEFDDLWTGAMGEILQRDEVVRSDSENTEVPSHPRRHLASTSLARLPLTCALRRSFLRTLGQHRLPLFLLALLLSLASYLRHTITSRRQTSARIPGLVSTTLQRLADQAARAGPDGEKGVLAAQLRDDILRDEWNLTKRETVWTRVRAVVEMNSNVRASRREVGGGEIGRVWEWIGSVESIFASPGDDELVRRRASGRLSLGFRDVGAQSTGTNEDILQRRSEGPLDLQGGAQQGSRATAAKSSTGWFESRPLY